MSTHREWKDAHTEAQRLANDTHLDLSIRKVKSYNGTEYIVSFASRNDSDYARAEIVRPERTAS